MDSPHCLKILRKVNSLCYAVPALWKPFITASFYVEAFAGLHTQFAWRGHPRPLCTNIQKLEFISYVCGHYNQLNGSKQKQSFLLGKSDKILLGGESFLQQNFPRKGIQ